jgi:SAM-dependent methyltransferase
MRSDVIDRVRSAYAAVARQETPGPADGLRAIAAAFGYSPEELAAMPDGTNLGLSCGNPTAFANLRPGETVVDLGCGAGIDVLLAARKVGPAGRAVGIDMTPEMVERARRNARAAVDEQVPGNVEFQVATIDRLPLADDSVDCLISNCVINLAPDKPAVFREVFRVLKPGGRVAVSDIALRRPLPADLAASVAAYVGCIAGAIFIEDYERGLQDAGFTAVQVLDAHKDLNVYALAGGQTGCCTPAMTSSSGLPAADCCTPGPPVHRGLAELAACYDFNEYAASVQVYALKPSH